MNCFERQLTLLIVQFDAVNKTILIKTQRDDKTVETIIQPLSHLAADATWFYVNEEELMRK